MHLARLSGQAGGAENLDTMRLASMSAARLKVKLLTQSANRLWFRAGVNGYHIVAQSE
jgi:hypothetical protein